MSEGNKRDRQIFVSFNTTNHRFNTTSIVKLFILKLLSNKNYYGQELINDIEVSFSGQWKPSPGMIYPLLRKMEENKWVEAWWDVPDKKSKRNYKITEEGKKYYEYLKGIYKEQLIESKNIIETVIENIYN